MATYYVSNAGNDANNGLGPDASDGVNKPWLTLGKVLAAGSIVVANDTVYIGPGVIRISAVITCAVSGSAGQPISLNGDPFNTKGFKTAAAVLLPATEIRLTAFSPNDTTRPASAFNLIALAGQSYLTFRWITFHYGRASGIVTSSALSTNITLEDCVFTGGEAGDCLRLWNGTANTPFNWAVNRCQFFSTANSGADIRAPSHTSDYDIGVAFTNCLFVCPNMWGIYFAPADTSNAQRAGGLIVTNCTLMCFTGLECVANVATQTFPSLWQNNLVCSGGTGLKTGHASQVTADFNHIFAYTPRTNVGVGANDKTYADGYCVLAELLQRTKNGFLTLPFATPSIGSPQIGYGAAASPTPPTTDFLGRIRPGYGGTILNSVGCLERHDGGAKDTTVYHSPSTAAIKLTGPGDHDIIIAVDATATTIAIPVMFGAATYGGTDYPQAILLAAGDLGVATETKTATVAASDAGYVAGTFPEILTFAAITPTAKGWVTIRLVNRGTGADDICWFSKIAVT